MAEGFEPSGELPPHALSRRVPSAARAGHRDESSGRSRSASARAGASDAPIEERGVRVAARPVAGGTRRRRTTPTWYRLRPYQSMMETLSWRCAHARSRALFGSRYGRGTFTVTRKIGRSGPATRTNASQSAPSIRPFVPRCTITFDGQMSPGGQLPDERHHIAELPADLRVHAEPASDQVVAGAEHDRVADRVATRRDARERGRCGQQHARGDERSEDDAEGPGRAHVPTMVGAERTEGRARRPARDGGGGVI